MLIRNGKDGVPIISDVTAEERRQLREMPYLEFLDTPFWRAVSRIVRARAGYKCQKCGNNRDLEAHHKGMRHHGKEDRHLNDLICLCHACHRTLHLSEHEGWPRTYKRRLLHTGPNTHTKWYRDAGPHRR